MYDLETSRISAPYIYDISNLRVNQPAIELVLYVSSRDLLQGYKNLLLVLSPFYRYVAFTLISTYEWHHTVAVARSVGNSLSHNVV